MAFIFMRLIPSVEKMEVALLVATVLTPPATASLPSFAISDAGDASVVAGSVAVRIVDSEALETRTPRRRKNRRIRSIADQ